MPKRSKQRNMDVNNWLNKTYEVNEPTVSEATKESFQNGHCQSSPNPCVGLKSCLLCGGCGKCKKCQHCGECEHCDGCLNYGWKEFRGQAVKTSEIIPSTNRATSGEIQKDLDELLAEQAELRQMKAEHFPKPIQSSYKNPNNDEDLKERMDKMERFLTLRTLLQKVLADPTASEAVKERTRPMLADIERRLYEKLGRGRGFGNAMEVQEQAFIERKMARVSSEEDLMSTTPRFRVERIMKHLEWFNKFGPRVFPLIDKDLAKELRATSAKAPASSFPSAGVSEDELFDEISQSYVEKAKKRRQQRAQYLADVSSIQYDHFMPATFSPQPGLDRAFFLSQYGLAEINKGAKPIVKENSPEMVNRNSNSLRDDISTISEGEMTVIITRGSAAKPANDPSDESMNETWEFVEEDIYAEV
ncbi:hypothetical protein L228DRAFT_284534 [Xylona heveae TC161]|uniref:Uncharacterized protein n=1 Tax=Xylona heveae (strain CBS 132557 / TC161) TaxID=1328760 RepID=A0A165AJD7_XYLHT|nr:hypothetical protein L228DRAFT_284534 [Xylona heveae TC161]KZF20576.1 hypothetical protein L228DRAFT_284534 [Xylona heveae TC161]